MNIISDIETGLLGFIKNSPTYGYAVRKQIEELSGVGIVWKIKLGRIYQMLDKLEENGLLQSQDILQENRPPKREFRITKEGLNIYKKWINEPIKHGREFRVQFLLKLYWAMDASSQASQQLIKKQIAECKTWVEKMEMANTNTKEKFLFIVHTYRVDQIKHYIDWLIWCNEYIRSKTP
jgi:DNA-binding PadR family transcriptional regulator